MYTSGGYFRTLTLDKAQEILVLENNSRTKQKRQRATEKE